MNIMLGLIFILHIKIWVVTCSLKCTELETCGQCIGLPDDKCVWCSAEEHDGPRCISNNEVINSTVPWCKDGMYNPELYHIEKREDKEFSDGVKKSKVIQFKPQSLKIKTRTNVPIRFNISYKPAKDYPLDIYYLMDYSESMRNYAITLREQGYNIIQKLKFETNDVKMGIGSFVDKPALPFAYFENGTYSYKHHLSLTDDISAFQEALKTDPTGFSHDLPEAGFDGLMQAMVCGEKVGWRKNAFHIILLSTDSTYHSAGDGKFVGAITPNDMGCHLENNMYSESLKYDYPSVSQINKVATDKNIMIIFAVPSTVKPAYDNLIKKIKNAQSVNLQSPSKMVDVILNGYRDIVNSVQLYVKVPAFVDLTFHPDCTIAGTCLYKHTESVKTVATLTVKTCPTNPNIMVTISPVTLTEKLSIEVKTECQCDCEKDGKGEKNSDKCSKAGTYQCGVCKCDKERHGDFCNCTENTTTIEDLNKCKENENEAKFCKGRGICSCGKCISCAKGFSGKFCQYDNESCPRRGGFQCSDHGKCVNGECVCNPGWLPDDCFCPDTSDSCIGPNSKLPCSGNGVCTCGECICARTTSANESCSGRYCDECDEPLGIYCKDLEGYALCNIESTKMQCDKQFNFTDTEVVLVNKTEMYSSTWSMVRNWCTQELNDGRTLIFKYRSPTLANKNRLLIIQNELDMPSVADVWLVVGATIGSILLIGALTMVAWIVLVNMHDKREYESFKKASEAAGFNVHNNPLYHEPTMDFRNPAYSGK